ncbi:adenosylcobyric acid synthase [Peptoniphilus ivorii]|uniref:cobyric acid synthase n=1 Tax=Aedoeadaptatus ivorii TaxID=54006 RepID=UPI00278B21C6|nr:cobyric acid synthase [Peptoniphilus ivorii]MDQ0508957.1 adenosylcobyric acid synthase [Peptoniphilus ivorii]
MGSMIVLGTASNGGKSTLVTALMRIYRRRGYRVCPFKSQNMALNSGIIDGKEMARAQIVQAEAAQIAPDVRMNPILLKPVAPGTSQVIVNGRVAGRFSTRAYYAKKAAFFKAALRSLESLREEYDIVIAEGAGSASEINLKSVDIVNMGLAKAADMDALLVADIDRGGMFGAVAGTHLLFDREERRRLKGIVVNKFRGDVSILMPGLETLEEITKTPVLGVIPYGDFTIEAEDSLSESLAEIRSGAVDVAVLRLPYMTDFTDFAPFYRHPDVSLRYIDGLRNFRAPDLLILPGTLRPYGDLKWLKESGLYAAVLKYAATGGKLVAVAEGKDLLGKYVKGDGASGGLEGFDLWNENAAHDASNADAVVATFDRHGAFEDEGITESLLAPLQAQKGISQKESLSDYAAYKESQYEKLADLVESSVDMAAIDRILGI